MSSTLSSVTATDCAIVIGTVLAGTVSETYSLSAVSWPGETGKWLNYLSTVKKVEDFCCFNELCQFNVSAGNITQPPTATCSDAIDKMLEATPIGRSRLGHPSDLPMLVYCRDVIKEQSSVLQSLSKGTNENIIVAVVASVASFLFITGSMTLAYRHYKRSREYTPLE